MVNGLEGEDLSFWVGTTNTTSYPALESDDTTYDVVVVGGGITGVITAYRLQRDGFTVALVEKSRIVEWTTGATTAKLTSQHYVIYDYLIKRHGKSTAAAYARANQDGIDEIEKLCQELHIDGDFERRDAYVFTNQDDKVALIQAEVAAAEGLGLPASFETAVDLPFLAKAAIKFSNQAQFHPRKFLLALASQFVAAGGVIYEKTKALDIKLGDPNTLVTKLGELRARSIVQASGEPFWGQDVLADRMWIKMSYGLAVTLKEPADYPTNMYITTDAPLRTIRSATYNDGRVMIFGGESHEYDDANFDANAETHYANLIDDVKQRFDVDQIVYRWLAGDFMPYDRIPYIGPHPDVPSIHVVTGYRAWGLAWALSAARVVAGYVGGTPLAWAEPFSLERLKTPLRADDKNTHL